MGRTCTIRTRREQAAKLILATYTSVQVDKVKQLLIDGGVVRTARHTYLAVSSNGTDRYQIDTAIASCTCPAGEHGHRCYHLAAAQLCAA